jgi:TolB-like protein
MHSHTERFPRHGLWRGMICCGLLAMLVALPGPAQAFLSFLADPKPPVAQPAPPPVNQAADLHAQVQELAVGLFASLRDPDPENGDLAGGLIVCSFVDLKKLSRTSSLGRYVAEQLMVELQQQGYSVVELRKGTGVLVQEKRGEFGLSRDPAQLREDAAAAAMLTGTYTVTGEQVILNARIMDNRSAVLLASATAIIPKNRVASLLLADGASLATRKSEPVYMKQLDL